MARPIRMAPDQADDLQDRCVDPHATEVPAAIRAAVLARMRAGDALWRCPRAGAPRGPLSAFGIGRQELLIEWWLVDADGELVEAFWLD